MASFSAISLSWAASDAVRQAPSYTASDVINSATGESGVLAPNSFATLRGTGLANTTRGLTDDDIRGGLLPTVLSGTGVRVLVGGFPAYIHYVSPTEVNFLIPSNLVPGPTNVQLVLDGRAGPSVKITLSEIAPGLFPVDESKSVVAAHSDGQRITEENPARPGEVIILYANGMGPTTPSIVNGHVPTKPARIKHAPDLRVWIKGEMIDQSQIEYAGIAPYLAGLYQITLMLPEYCPDDPEVRIELPGIMSPEGTKIWVRRPASE